MDLDRDKIPGIPDLIHHQDVISPSSRELWSGIVFDRSSLRRIAHTPRSSLLDALHLTPYLLGISCQCKQA